MPALGIQLGVCIHVEEGADGCPTSKFVPVAALVDDLTKGVQAYEEQQGLGWTESAWQMPYLILLSCQLHSFLDEGSWSSFDLQTILILLECIYLKSYKLRTVVRRDFLFSLTFIADIEPVSLICHERTSSWALTCYFFLHCWLLRICEQTWHFLLCWILHKAYKGEISFSVLWNKTHLGEFDWHISSWGSRVRTFVHQSCSNF